MSIGYFDDIADADTYFEDERLETEAWDDLDELSGDILKTKVLIQAYNRLYYDPRWSLPTYATATVAELVELKKANGETAYYLAVHLADEDRRKGLQAQGVIKAGIVKEDYSEQHLMDLPVPPFVIAIMAPWSTKTFAGALDVRRDDEEDITL